MFPGLTTKISEETLASAATIKPKADLVKVTGTTSISNIIPPYAGFCGMMFLIPLDGNVILLDTGNIMISTTIFHNIGTVMVFSKALNKWFCPVLG